MSKKTAEQISYNMSQVKCKDSQIEIMLRKELWKKGFRYRKNFNRIFGKPDIVFIKEKIAVFCDSEFWHGYNWEEKRHEIKSRREFWIPKIERTIERDQEVTKYLQNDGWIVIRFWGKEIINDKNKCAKLVEKAVKKRRK
jgi:DNA mismatch endonuclease (patch repair protein)